MIEYVNNLKFQYLVELSKQGKRCLDYKQRVSDLLVANNVTFGSEPIPFLLMPHFLATSQIDVVRKVVHHLSSALEKFVHSYLADPKYKALLGVTDREDELFRIDPGYSRSITICRLDAFLDQYDLKFLEFNADSPAGIGYCDNLYAALSQTLDLPDVHYEFEEGYERMLPHLFEVMTATYAEFRANGRTKDFPEVPTMAILDWTDVVTSTEFRIIQKHFEEQGVRTLIGDPRHLELDADGFPMLGGERIHLIYRRALVRELIAKGAEVTNFMAAAAGQRACVVNAMRSIVAGNKKVLAVLLDEEWQQSARLTSDELEVIRNTIPWTRILREEKTGYEGWTINLRDFVSDNRERLVIKPAKGYAGQHVYLGIETPQEKWDRVIADAVTDSNWVVQEYIPVPEEMFPVIEGGALQMKLKKFNINPFALGGEYSGIITRISDSLVINVTANGGLLPCCTGTAKQHLFEKNRRRDHVRTPPTHSTAGAEP